MKIIRKILAVCFVLAILTGTSMFAYVKLFADAAVDVGTEVYESIPEETKETITDTINDFTDEAGSQLKSWISSLEF